jgi:imidazolonepropionase-like amidohydrolase
MTVDWMVVGARVLPLAGVLVLGIASDGSAQTVLRPIGGDSVLPIGTVRGERGNRIVVRGATILSGRGTPNSPRAMPPEGPIDVVIEGNTIVDMVLMDPVNLASAGPNFQRPTGDRIIDAAGMVLMPGLIEMHAHLPRNGGDLGAQALEYTYRLYLGHGVTTVRDAGTGAGLRTMTEQRRGSAANQIVAPRLVLCQRWPLPLREWDEGNTPEKARVMVRSFKEQGADCVKVSKSPGHYPDVLQAIAAEAKALGMFVMVDLKVSETDAVVASNAGVRSIEHWYGVPDAALMGTQNFPPDYNYWDELDRFRYAGKLWEEADQYPERLSKVIDLLIANGTNWNVTFAPYEKNRDVWRSVTLPWRETLVHPAMLEAGPDSTVHGSYHREWKTSDEITWRRNFQIWMRWVREYHRRGGLLTAGSDEGEVGGIQMIRELELLQEAGIHPIDVIKVATTNAAHALGWERHCGVRVGCVADLAVVNGNPIDNLKVLYGRGYGFAGIVPRAARPRHGGVVWTIKDGVVYDAQALLREAEWYVAQEKRRVERMASNEEK